MLITTALHCVRNDNAITKKREGGEVAQGDFAALRHLSPLSSKGARHW
ncbi:MAG: hypothetical protein LBG47_00860 [Prevotellaceae bacterium]|nr:hypothetical protein [Prevotellaceae bacterium]